MPATKKFSKPSRWRGSMSANKAALVLSSADAASTQAIAARLAGLCRSGDCILLYGDLGAGKTTFARGFIQSLYPGEEVVSPTFTLMQAYQPEGKGAIRHFDLYRLKNKQELEELGLRDALSSGITLIEWPELAQSELPEEALSVTLGVNHCPEYRQIAFLGQCAAWQERLVGLKNNE